MIVDSTTNKKMSSLEQMKADCECEHIKAHTHSLLSNPPTEGTTPNVWVFDETSQYFEADKLWLQQNFPTHRVIPFSGSIKERGESSLNHRIDEYNVIRANTHSLLSTAPTKRTTPNVVALDVESPDFERDKLYINQSFPHYHVSEMAGVLTQRGGGESHH